MDYDAIQGVLLEMRQHVTVIEEKEAKTEDEEYFLNGYRNLRQLCDESRGNSKPPLQPDELSRRGRLFVDLQPYFRTRNIDTMQVILHKILKH